ncbi:phosphoadenosine phosphosulfate reductase [Cryptococcus deuterogattii 99/473]|uniref:Unplaced genomic scaffold supercont1.12, whole genome shotgun sequence n=2 Tax=Cryptococcus deuterogattii TaxID=1859096 RepID=A0A0D0V2Y5_9TREE|nr:phosphoadenosine phosphosulfate reductase [Cryptococcus deuterogattii R265]KIR28862.1 phosphoadenosine phosphosulfate reductase [Cryptococcus deuterogattii LA55]KIR39285.1 phosphoadenosine phosphosulfate reductase [Cryptococcus deuterogattii Ram5]KIR71113.1 phosphoadenosine phosphosulfate reductase [Cryptococcus deuterogattii CA1014]KIR94707.1 phosphoadenosine phosphosulfate reductase [Cryptococcus deuterogattii CBS 10090]KIS00768.1 phosphoadenosine phosphosulfate reductase [Cryptococcus de
MSSEDILTPQYTPEEIERFNAELDGKTPQEILTWAVDNVDGLYQTTAFGLTGTAAVDMISKISLSREETHLVPLIFLDTLHHFPETLALAQTMADTYLAPLHIYTPPGVSAAEEFAAKYGENLWETDEGAYDYLVKVEPAARAYKELGVRAVITGRRRSQGADRANLKVLEIDERGLLKINPLIGWSFKEVKEYIDKEGVPYNPLLDKGYRSIGDVHSTAPPDPNAASDAAERSGRWQGKAKTECGLHTNYFEMKKKFEEKAAAAGEASKQS